VVISAIQAETSNKGDSGLRLYLPSAQFYSYITVNEVRYRQETTVGEVLAAVRSQLQLSADFRLTLRRGRAIEEVRLYGSERISSVVLSIQVGPVTEAWPRLFLRPLD
jgi:hypothetical protein